MLLMLPRRSKINEWLVSLHHLFLSENKNKSYWRKKNPGILKDIHSLFTFGGHSDFFFPLAPPNKSCLIRGLASRLKKCNQVLFSSKYLHSENFEKPTIHLMSLIFKIPRYFWNHYQIAGRSVSQAVICSLDSSFPSFSLCRERCSRRGDPELKLSLGW